MKVQDYKVSKFNNNLNLRMVSLTEDIELVKQIPDLMSIHKPEKKWLLLTSEVGYFNKVTHFVSGDVASLLFINSNGELCYPTLTEVEKNPMKYFMIYPLPFNMNLETNNKEVEFLWESKQFKVTRNEKETIQLNFKNGIEIGRTFFYYTGTNRVSLSKFEEAINGSNDRNYFWPNKNLIINSNPEFVMGILFGYLKESIDKFSLPENEKPLKEKLYLNKTNNSYIFSTILNWLGASYSFQNIELITNGVYQTNMRMHITLPHYLLNIFRNAIKELSVTEDTSEYEEFRKIFKSHEWFLTTKNKVRKMPIGAKEKSKSNYNTLIDEGKIRIVPMSSFKFVEVKNDLEMYDFTMPRADATNYAITFCPILKNSDGDILTLSAIYGKEAIEDAKAFEPTHKEWFRNLNNGAINNYIADDAILGLYSATKFLG